MLLKNIKCRYLTYIAPLNILCFLHSISLYNFRYGYATNTKIKFIIVSHSSNTSLRDNDVKMVNLL